VKLLLVPEIVNVASVWVDHVPADRRPPTAEPDRRALMVAFVGKLAGAVYNSYQKTSHGVRIRKNLQWLRLQTK
jgi:hypothetical protein